ncbi:hypothetical protein [Mesorhizobium delmotii]|uniref:hypothetical protein n=1 Tax=Mesorhizobium delmotii TaxID=1631247 RepID=UPI001057F6D7|nr:hypothetical protein [Mesorhizobium delmotii]
MKRILLTSAVLALSAGLSFAQTTSGTSGGTSTTTTTTTPSTDQGTDTTTTSGTNPNSAKDCAPGQQPGNADAKTRRPQANEEDHRRLLIGNAIQGEGRRRLGGVGVECL